jgi:hypothetical protein
VKTNSSLNNYLSTSAVTLPTDVSKPYGNMGRNAIRDNAFYQLNTGLHKVFALWNEASNLDFRAEAFNALNAVNYQNPTSDRASGSYGNITGYFPPRQIQLALKLNF